MAEYFSRSWTGTNGDQWDEISEGWEKVMGGAGDALISSNAGHCGSTATERIYRATSFAPTGSYKPSVGITWKNAAGAGRVAGGASRVSGDGTKGYTFEVDSNLGTARARIRRRRSGSFTDVVAWTDISGSVSAATLNAGPTIEFRTETLTDGTVALRLKVGGYTAIDTIDSNAAAILSGGAVGVYIGANCTSDDVVFDDLSVLDFEDEAAATPAELATDVSMIIDSKHYSDDELAAAGVIIGVGVSSEGVEPVWTLRDSKQVQDANTILYTGAVVHIVLNGTVVAFGRVRPAKGHGTPVEGHSYEVHGSKRLAEDVEIIDPVNGSQHVVFNAEEGHEDYRSDRVGITLRVAAKWVLDTFLDGDGGLRSQLAAPASGVAYVAADLAGGEFDLIVPKLTISGNVTRAIETILSYTTFGVRVAPGTLLWRFRDRFSGTLKAFDLASDHLEFEVSTNTDKNFSALRIFGTKAERQVITFTNDLTDGLADLAAGHVAALEATTTKALGGKNRDVGLVSSKGTAGGKVTMDPSPTGPPAFSMVANEWDATDLTFDDGAEAGNTYRLETNSTGTFTFEATAWLAGGPSAGDQFTVAGALHNGGKDNGYRNVGRRFELDDVTYGIPPGGEVEVVIWDGAQQVAANFVFEAIPTDPAAKQGVIVDLPALGFFNSTDPQDVCKAGDIGTSPPVVQIKAEVINRTAPNVPSLRRPATEGTYTGTCFTQDSSKWSGGGEPGPGDAGVMRTYPMAIPEYTGTAEQDAAYGAMADALLAVLSPLAREVQIKIAGTLDETLADLDFRVQITDSSGARSMGYLASMTDLPAHAVEFDRKNRTTTVYAGTQSSGKYDLQAWRRGLLLKNGADLAGRIRRDMRDLLPKVQNGPPGGGLVGIPDPSPIGDCQVIVHDAAGNAQSLADERDKECHPMGVTAPCEPSCVTYPCGIVSNGGQYATNAAAAASTAAHGDALATTLAWALRHISMIWCNLGDLSSSVDQELDKARNDLANVFNVLGCLENAIVFVDTRVTNLQNCVNAAFVQIAACFGNKLDGVGTPCDITSCETPEVTVDCVGTTETVCEDPCPVDVPDPGALGSDCLDAP